MQREEEARRRTSLGEFSLRFGGRNVIACSPAPGSAVIELRPLARLCARGYASHTMSSLSDSLPLPAAASALVPPLGDLSRFVFLGERLWLDFVNTDDVRRGARVDVLRDFEAYIAWLHAAHVF